jgi:hypothetical protein
MKHFPLCLVLAVIGLGSFPLGMAQEVSPAGGRPAATDEDGPNRFWQAAIGAGHYMVALDRITAVSRHQYLLDGGLVVDEVIVDAVGQSLARFYFIRPITDTTGGSGLGGIATRAVGRAEELVEKGAARLGTNAHEMVQKNYPTTTHARTVEFRILSEKNLADLHNSVRRAWENGRGRSFRIE